ncbi:MAG: hemolysin family protein, partial [Actinomycetia bacterium]|nr:hemolysin family protein [Actinomycetes bacterium]
MESYLSPILILLGLILLNGFFSAAEVALITARKSALHHRAEEGHKGAAVALDLTEDTTSMLSTIQIAITLIDILSSAFATLTFAEPLTQFMRSLGFAWVTPLASAIAILIITLVLSYLSIVIGELLPKRLGLIKSDWVAEFVSRPIWWLQTLLSPIVGFLTLSTNALSVLLGLTDDKLDDEAGEEEIKMLVTEQDSLEEAEKRMIHEIFDLGDTVVREIMTPRVDVLAAQDSDTLKEVMALLEDTGLSRVPVLHGDLDSVVGIAYFKDLVRPLSTEKGEELITAHMRPAQFIPETKDILSLLEEMQKHRMHMMIVVDEHGGSAGIVTMEDIVEEIVGEITDEFDTDSSDIIALNDKAWLVEGRLSVDDAIEQGFPLEDSDEYDTVAGWFLEQIGHIPRAGERIDHEGYTFVVQNMRRR